MADNGIAGNKSRNFAFHYRMVPETECRPERLCRVRRRGVCRMDWKIPEERGGETWNVRTFPEWMGVRCPNGAPRADDAWYTRMDGKVYVLHSYVLPEATYATPNKGFLFDGSKFSGEFELIDPVDNQSQNVKLPIKPNELICDFTLVDYDACTVETQDDAPDL